MKSQAALLGVKQAAFSPESDLWRHAAVRPLADHEAPLAEHQAPRSDGRDFSQVPVHASGLDGGHAEASCPLTPTRCPFGGVCHTCPTQVQAKRVEGQAQNVPEQVPPIVHEVLRSPGQPLDADTRAVMEPRFGHDFSRVRVHAAPLSATQSKLAIGQPGDQYEYEANQVADIVTQMPEPGRVEASTPGPGLDFGVVRIHTDAKAAESARAVDALAYTVGRDIVFRERQYAPGTAAGRRLLAHELTHVVQQSQQRGAPGRLQRVGFFESIGIFFGLIEGDFSDKELQEYLDKVVKNDRIEGSYDSDNKARAIVRKWMASGQRFVLGSTEKKLLILEMQDGYVSDGDKNCILNLLENSSRRDLRIIFGAGGVNPTTLNKDFGVKPGEGEEGQDEFQRRLRAFYAASFRGGMAAALHETIEPTSGLDLRRMTLEQRQDFIQSHFPRADRPLASRILEDLAQSHDEHELNFANEEELRNEIFKRMRTSQLMQQTQTLFGRAFEYPNKPAAKRCLPNNEGGQRSNPRVNKEAEPYWGPVQYDSRGSYFFELKDDTGRNNAYRALTTLFKPQHSICDMTLIHCDYLASVVHFRAFAETIGVEAFNSRVKSRLIPMTLKWNGFTDLERTGWSRPLEAVSLQEVRPLSEEDLVIGDHVIFWNHRAYDLINEKTKNAWRLENAILIDKRRNEDIFLGHGSGRKAGKGMLQKLAREYNEVVGKARAIIARTRSAISSVVSAALAEMRTSFPHLEKEGEEWKITGRAHGKIFNEPLQEVSEEKPEENPEMIGLHDPEYPQMMNYVKRPIESA
jgi:hypothetical protein